MLKLGDASSAELKALGTRVKQDIDAYTKAIYNDGFRWHMGASKIAHECKRHLWYMFRWVGQEEHSGRMQRLFNRGHKEEERHDEWLRGMGFGVWTRDETETKPDGTHPQFRIKNKCRGHLGGSIDRIVSFPESYRIEGYAIGESKTSGTGAKFNDLDKKGMASAKPEHYIQNSIYGHDYNIEHALYMCANKNDDDLYIEIVKLDFQLAKDMEVKAESIIFSQEPPPKLSENPTFFTCKSLCEYKELCHYGKPAVVNCRSCVHCSAVDAGEFYCSTHNGTIPRDVVRTGCPQWASITLATSGK